MATKFLLGKGSTFSVSSDGGTTFVPVHQLKTIVFNGSKAEFDDITNMDSPGTYHEVAPTLLDPGTADVQGVFAGTDAGQTAVSAAFDAQTLLQCKLQFAARTGETLGAKRAFSAYVGSKPSIDAQMDKASTFAASFKISGPIVDTAPGILPTGITGSTTSASPSITVSSGTNIVPGLTVSGAGIPAGSTVLSITGTTMVISANATATASGVALTFTA